MYSYYCFPFPNYSKILFTFLPVPHPILSPPFLLLSSPLSDLGVVFLTTGLRNFLYTNPEGLEQGEVC